MRGQRGWGLGLALGLALGLGLAEAEPDGGVACEDEDGGICGIAVEPAGPGAPRPAPVPAQPSRTLLVFWGVDCPRCEAARPVVRRLARAARGLRVEWIEAREDATGRRRFAEVVRANGIRAPGVPLFVLDGEVVVGFRPGVTEDELEALVRGEPRSRGGRVELPLVGAVDPGQIPLPAFTLLVGLVDGFNPCAMWVLVVLMGILLHAGSRGRVLLYGGTFVVMSGLVYFLFMSAWSLVFRFAGMSRALTIALGVVVVGMGLVNLKELVWWKHGPSLMIPEAAKPGLYRRMRAIAFAAKTPTALLGVAALAFVVNLVELGCTLGLPAVYTRILSLHTELSRGTRVLYLALYNVAYVVPLAVIVTVAGATLRRLTITERGAKLLKAVSGAVLLAFGLLLIFAPGLLS